VAACAVHCAVLVTLLAWALVDYDGQPVPWRWAAAMTALAVAAAAWLPGVQPVGAGFGAGAGWPAAAVASAAGMLAGWLVGRIHRSRAAAVMFILLGAALGWQAVVSVGAFALALVGLWRLLGAAWPAAGAGHIAAFDIVIAAVGHQLAWRIIHQIGVWWDAV
jgi:hypothetical protein